MLREAGTEKINFSGGEPFLIKRGSYLGEMVRQCKLDLEYPSVTIVSNGSKITASWFKKYGKYIDILAISVDSFVPETNKAIGRFHGSGSDHIASLMNVRRWCEEHKVAFKINTVVNSLNVTEDMVANVRKLNPVRWKLFQCLEIQGENTGEGSLRSAEKFTIPDEEFQSFVKRHKEKLGEIVVPESNEKMRNSYLILDEYMRFLDNTGGAKKPSKSILDVGVDVAIQNSGFDEKMFFARGGKYKWSNKDGELEW